MTQKVSFNDAPSQWFKAFALAGVDVSGGGEFDVDDSNASNIADISLDESGNAVEASDVSIQGTTCYICYKAACLICKHN